MALMKTPRTLAAAAVTAMFLVLYGPALFAGNLFYSADNFAFYFTGQRHWFESFSLWNPFINLGSSFLHNPTWGIFYLPHYLQLAVNPEIAMRFFWIPHFFLLAWAVYRWAKASDAADGLVIALPALVAGSAAINVFSVSQLIYLYAATWSAWILSELAQESKGRFSWGRLLLYWGLLVSNGEVFTVFLMGIVIGVWALAGRRWKGLAGFALTSLLLGIVIYGHTALVLPYTARAAVDDTERRLAFSVHPFRLVTLFSPYFWGHMLKGGFHGLHLTTPPYANRFFYDTIHLPLPLLMLALAGLVRAARERRWLWIGLFAFSALLAFGKWGLLGILHDVPPFRFLRSPEKAIFVSVLLFSGFAIRHASFDDLRPSRPWIFAVAALAIGLPLLSSGGDWPFSLLSAAFFAALWAWHQGWIPVTAVVAAMLAIGGAQNFLAHSPQRLVDGSTIHELSPLARELLKLSPENGFARFEFAPGISATDQPHADLVYGMNMLHHRPVALGYDSIESPLIEEMMSKLLGAVSLQYPRDPRVPMPPEEIQGILQLTNLHWLAVENRTPVTPLLASVDSEAGVFRPAAVTQDWTILEAARKPHPLWFFPKLERWREDAPTRLMWPPQVETEKPFLGGIRKKNANAAASYAECADASARGAAFDDRSLRRDGDDRILLSFRAPCDGWVYLSQHLVPGWTLRSGEREVPLLLMNGNLLGFHVRAGEFRGILEFRPWFALWNALTGAGG